MTDAAAAGLGLTGIGVEPVEDYPDVGQARGQAVELDETSAGA